MSHWLRLSIPSSSRLLRKPQRLAMLSIATFGLALSIGSIAMSESREVLRDANELELLRLLQMRMKVAKNANGGNPKIVAADATDFTATLEAFPPTATFVEDVRAKARETGIQIVNVGVTSRSATKQTLARDEVGVGLRGPYMGVRSILKATTERAADFAVLRRLTMRLAGSDVSKC